jgi:hypothetical protein
MTNNENNLQFEAKLLRPAKPVDNTLWAFVILPKEISAKLRRRGRVTVNVFINGHNFQTTLEPDGQLSHWLKVTNVQLKAAKTDTGEIVTIDIIPLQQEPEPEVPMALQDALKANPKALLIWNETTSIARLDWIHWITSAKQTKTREKRINNACDMLSSGKKRVCCFDQSGFYSKAFSAPESTDS